MTKDEIYQIVNTNIIDVLADTVTLDDITIEKRLKDIGANSIDRMEIVTMSMETLGLKIPLLELGMAKNIQDLVDIFFEHKKVSIEAVV